MSLRLDAVVHRYGRGPDVLRGVNLEVHDGESVAIMGPSGSGKTTLLAVLGLLTTPTAGTVSVDGQLAPAAGAARHRLRSGVFSWVFQTVNVLSRRTVVDNVAVPLLTAGETRSAARKKAHSVLSQVGLQAYVDVPVRRLSGGETQRVCIARALVARPRFLLADEPTGQLDQSTSRQVLDVMWALLSSTGAGLVVATHDPEVAERCGRVIDLVDGRAVPR